MISYWEICPQRCILKPDGNVELTGEEGVGHYGYRAVGAGGGDGFGWIVGDAIKTSVSIYKASDTRADGAKMNKERIWKIYTPVTVMLGQL